MKTYEEKEEFEKLALENNRELRPLSIEELNNMSLNDLNELENDLWNYRNNVKTVIAYQKIIRASEDLEE